LAISLSIRDIVNHNNPGPIIGNITSLWFGVANQPYGIPTVREQVFRSPRTTNDWNCKPGLRFLTVRGKVGIPLSVLEQHLDIVISEPDLLGIKSLALEAAGRFQALAESGQSEQAVRASEPVLRQYWIRS
jgi:hypothetical protein